MNLQKRVLLFLFLLSLQVIPSSGQSFVGKKAPNITPLAFVQSAADPLKQLDNKVVVMEFWATWCGPCLANQQHLNQLQTAFKDKNVVFISVSDESTEKIKRFLKKREIKGWVACDTSRKMHSALNVEGIPRTFVVGKDGTILYDGSPSYVTEKVLLAALDGKADYSGPEPLQKTSCSKFGSWSPGVDPVFTAHFDGRDRAAIFPYQHTIRKSVGTSGIGYSYSEEFSGMTLLGLNISELYAFCLDLPGNKKVLNLSPVTDKQKWDIIFSRNCYLETDTMVKMVMASLKETFHVSVKDTVIQQQALVASIASSAPVMKEETIDLDDPAKRSYATLTELFTDVENDGEQIVLIKEEYAKLYLDTYEIASTRYKMEAEQLKTWLTGKGITFSVQKSNINMVVVR